MDEDPRQGLQKIAFIGSGDKRNWNWTAVADTPFSGSKALCQFIAGCDCSESHWATEDSHLRLVQCVESKHAPDGEH